MSLPFEAAVRTQQGNQVLREIGRASPDYRLLMLMLIMMEKLTATRKQLEVALG
ncbi:hypothetical protein [Pseudomonas syringae]|uniref:hypothetical protein n=1 Tax=Pseudomonas syringae TaxID=317 RepID=UPI000B313AF0|nr:hypothetical protein [Pseudomonas syringae]